MRAARSRLELRRDCGSGTMDAMLRSLSKHILPLASILCFGAACPCQVTRVLLSVDNLHLPAGESLSAFRIDTWGVALVSVCHVPPDWNLTEQKYQNPAGLLSGRSDHGEVLRELHEMYLVDVYSYQPLSKGDPKGEYHPATFSGWVEVATNPDATRGKRQPLTANNFHLTPATRCPLAPPPEP